MLEKIDFLLFIACYERKCDRCVVNVTLIIGVSSCASFIPRTSDSYLLQLVS